MRMRYCYFITAFILTSFVFAQSTIEGIVYDETGVPLSGANVVVEGTAFGAATGGNGDYMINIPAGSVRVTT